MSPGSVSGGESGKRVKLVNGRTSTTAPACDWGGRKRCDAASVVNSDVTDTGAAIMPFKHRAC